MNQEEFIAYIRKEAEKIPDEKIYFTMRKLRIKGVHPQGQQTMKCAIALFKNGLYTTVSLIQVLRNVNWDSACTALHILGDKKCLTLLRSDQRRVLTWVPSALFIQAYQENLKVDKFEVE